MTSTAQIAADFTALCQAGQMDAAGEKYWAADVTSVEAMAAKGMDAAVTGIDAVRAKGEWWYANHEVHSVETSGPHVNGDQFIVQFAMDITPKTSGERMQMTESAMYTVRDGKIVEERFFY